MALLQRLMDDLGGGGIVENASAPPRPARERNAKKLDERLAVLLGQTSPEQDVPAPHEADEDKAPR